MNKIIIISSLFFILVGCGESVKTAEYWRNNHKERAEYLELCNRKSPKVNLTSCENALKSLEEEEPFYGVYG